MKTIVQIFMFACLLMLPHIGFSQHGYARATDMDVKGIFIGGTYSKAQVQAKWGTPMNYRSGMSEFGLNEVYDYYNLQNRTGKNQFHFGDNGVFHTFTIETSNFSVYTSYGGGIKVGDNISRIQAIGLGTPVLQNNGTYHLYRNNMDDPLVFGHINGVIIRIMFMSSI